MSSPPLQVLRLILILLITLYAEFTFHQKCQILLEKDYSLAFSREQKRNAENRSGRESSRLEQELKRDLIVKQDFCYDSFFCYIARPLTRFLSLHTVLPEHLPPKHSFLFTCCAWFLYSISTHLLWTSFFLHVLPQHSLIPSITQPSLPFISILALVLQTLLGPCAAYSPI